MKKLFLLCVGLMTFLVSPLYLTAVHVKPPKLQYRSNATQGATTKQEVPVVESAPQTKLDFSPYVNRLEPYEPAMLVFANYMAKLTNMSDLTWLVISQIESGGDFSVTTEGNHAYGPLQLIDDITVDPLLYAKKCAARFKSNDRCDVGHDDYVSAYIVWFYPKMSCDRSFVLRGKLVANNPSLARNGVISWNTIKYRVYLAHSVAVSRLRIGNRFYRLNQFNLPSWTRSTLYS